MAYALRPASLLPAIKCTNCGDDIQIAHMAEHICSSTEEEVISPPPPPPPPKDTSGPGASFFSGGLMSTVKAANIFKSSKGAPPSIDSKAANKPFFSSNASPFSAPHNSRRSPQSDALQKGPTSPLVSPLSRPYDRPSRPYEPPSPELENLDSPYPPFPSKPSYKKDESSPFSGGWNRKNREMSEDSLYAPVSPRTNGGANVIGKMDSIMRGPFGGRGLNKPDQGLRSPSLPSKSVANWSKNDAPPEKMGEVFQARPASVASSRSSNYSTGFSLPGSPVEQVSPVSRPSRDDGYNNYNTGHNQYADSSMRGPGNSMSSGVRSQNHSRTPTRDDGRENFRERNPYGYSREPSPPRPTNNNSNYNVRNEERGPAREPYKRDQTYGDNLHTPTDSASSDGSSSSGFDTRSTSSISTAPSVFSEASRKPSRVEPPMANVDYEGTFKGNDDHKATENETQGGFFGGFASSAKNLLWNSAGNTNRSNTSEPEYTSEPAPVKSKKEPELRPNRQTVIDPAIQMGMYGKTAPPSRPRKKENDRPVPKSRDSDRSFNMPKVPPIPTEYKSKETPAQRAATTKKGKCRGCNKEIVGKSVKAADGQLTGRYHKECFVCKTCRAPFLTADFYVFNNAPYCERHYHRLNNSVCKSCNRGIEGEYLETDLSEKFHPRCFTCSRCRIPLRDDYFELGGRIYCERHAFSAARENTKLLPPGRRNPEKRKTRLMMM